MNAKLLVWILFFPIFLFCLLMFYIEVSLYSTLPADLGGMSFWLELKFTWYRSVWFYAMSILILFILFFSLLPRKKK